MINGQEPPTLLTCPVPDPVEPYTPDGRYTKGQRIFHPDHGLGTVVEVRMFMVHIQFDQARTEDCPQETACLPSAKLSLGELTQANHFSVYDQQKAVNMFSDDLVALFAAQYPGIGGRYTGFPFV